MARRRNYETPRVLCTRPDAAQIVVAVHGTWMPLLTTSFADVDAPLRWHLKRAAS